jgi:hypothetical protein
MRTLSPVRTLRRPSLTSRAWRRSSSGSSRCGARSGEYPGLLLRAAQQLGLDAELAERETVVGVELHLRAAGEGEALLAAVLQQVVRQLLAEGRLVARELLAILRRQENPVVVGDVDARDGDHLVVLHLLGELVRQLDRLHARLERAAERALHQAAELRLQIA